MKKFYRLTGAALAAATLVAGCGGDDSSAPAAALATSSTTSASGTPGSAAVTTTTAKASAGGGAMSKVKTGEELCALFPLATVAELTGLKLEKARPSGPQVSTASCDYEANDAFTSSFSIRTDQPGKNGIDAVKGAFPRGQAVSGLGDAAWMSNTEGSGQIDVEKDKRIVTVQYVYVTARTKPTVDEVNAVNKKVLTAILAKF